MRTLFDVIPTPPSTPLGVWRRDLQTFVVSVTYDFESRTGRLVMPSPCCTSMPGAIRLFRKIDPKVQRIETISGDRRDTTYVRNDRPEWEALLPERTS